MRGKSLIRAGVVAAAMALVLGAMPAHAFTLGPAVATGLSPAGTTVDPFTGNAYVANMYAGSVTVISLTNIPSPPIPVGPSPRSVAMQWSSPAMLWVATYTGVTKMNTVTHFTTPIATPSWTAGVVVNQLTGRVYATMPDLNEVAVIDGNANSYLGAIPVGTFPHHLDWDINLNKLFVGNYGDGTLSVVDLTTSGLGLYNNVTTVPACSNPRDVSARWPDQTVWLACEGSGTVTVINGAASPVYPVIATIPVNGSPEAVAISQNDLYVQATSSLSSGAGEVTRIGPTFNTAGTLTVGGFPAGISINWNTLSAGYGRSYVAEFLGSDVQVINP